MAEEVLADVGCYGYLFLGCPLSINYHGRKIVRNLLPCQQKNDITPKNLCKLDMMVKSRLMAQTVSNQFHAALTYLLVREGRGAQSRLALQQGIDRGYLNAIIKGRKSGSEAIREKITEYFRMEYEEMLALGRRLLDGQSGSPPAKGKVRKKESSLPEVAVQEENDMVAVDCQPTMAMAISEKMVKVIQILESQTIYREILSGMIDAFHGALMAQNDRGSLRTRISLLEAKLAQFEGG
jgi:hypothetical protein